MTKPKTQRNELIVKFYTQGKTDTEILEGLLKAGFDDYKKVGSVRMLLARLRKSGKVPKARPVKGAKTRRKQQVDKVISPQVNKSTYPLVHKRATYYLTSEIVRKIKQIALNREIDSSGLVREILSEWISEQVDK